MSHTFAIGNASFTAWDTAKRAAVALAAERGAPVPVTRDDGRVWTIAPRLANPRNAPPAAPAQQAAQVDNTAQLVAAISKLNATIDALNSRVEALETKKRARSTKS